MPPVSPKTEVWFAIPSANPEKCRRVLPVWKKMGYKIAVLQNLRREPIPADLTVWYDYYPGWPGSVNILCKQIVPKDCQIIVTGGDDMLPDPKHTAQELAQQFLERFPDTFGVMQPHGDDFMVSQLYCGSPFIGRKWFDSMYGGKGPMHDGYRHNWADNELFWLAKGFGALWDRPDLSHFHDHFTRTGGDKPSYWRENVECADLEDCRKYIHRSWSRFPDHEPVATAGITKKFDSSVLAQGAMHLAEIKMAQVAMQETGRVMWSTAMKRGLTHCATNKLDKVAIYGAGTHTRNVPDALMESPVTIDCIIDDNASRHGKKMWGWPVVSREEAIRRGVKAVVFSANSHEPIMWDNSGVFMEAGIEVVRLYPPLATELDRRLRTAIERCRAAGCSRIVLANLDGSARQPGGWLEPLALQVEGMLEASSTRTELFGRPVFNPFQAMQRGIDAIIDCGTTTPDWPGFAGAGVRIEWMMAPKDWALNATGLAASA